MKILLLGDYSAVHKNLKEALLQLGYDVKLASNGDWEKQIPGMDFRLANDKTCNKFLRKYYDEIEPLLNHKFYGYDIVQAVTASLFDWKNRLNIYKRIISNNKHFFCLLSGDDYYVYNAWKNGKFRYMSFDDNDKLVNSWIGETKAHKLNEIAYNYVLEHSKGIIPINPYELEIPYYGMKNLRRYIPFPINLDNIEYITNKVRDNKIVIYHGITRPQDKGSDYIVNAMNYIADKYPNDVECISTGLIPYYDWIKIINRANIIIDQCKSYSYGMSAAIAMARGKVVLSGLEPEVLPSIKTPDCPIYNIIPNTDQIIGVIEDLIAQKNNIEEIGYKGRLFTEIEHDYIKVAKMYVEEWNK